MKYTKEQLEEVVKKSYSVAQVLRNLGLYIGGGNYASIKSKIKKFNIDSSHFIGQRWNKGRVFGPKRDIQDYFNNKAKIESHGLRVKLLKLGLKQHKCEACNLSEWNNLPIPLELDHIDGNHFNNNFTNLRILCPNCHAQTPTHRSKNRKDLKSSKPKA